MTYSLFTSVVQTEYKNVGTLPGSNELNTHKCPFKSYHFTTSFVIKSILIYFWFCTKKKSTQMIFSSNDAHQSLHDDEHHNNRKDSNNYRPRESLDKDIRTPVKEPTRKFLIIGFYIAFLISTALIIPGSSIALIFITFFSSVAGLISMIVLTIAISLLVIIVLSTSLITVRKSRTLVLSILMITVIGVYVLVMVALTFIPGNLIGEMLSLQRKFDNEVIWKDPSKTSNVTLLINSGYTLVHLQKPIVYMNYFGYYQQVIHAGSRNNLYTDYYVIPISDETLNVTFHTVTTFLTIMNPIGGLKEWEYSINETVSFYVSKADYKCPEKLLLDSMVKLKAANIKTVNTTDAMCLQLELSPDERMQTIREYKNGGIVMYIVGGVNLCVCVLVASLVYLLHLCNARAPTNIPFK